MTEMEKELRGTIQEEMLRVQKRRNGVCWLTQTYSDLGALLCWWRTRLLRLDKEGAEAFQPVLDETLKMQALTEAERIEFLREENLKGAYHG
jgi:hypothetical protein